MKGVEMELVITVFLGIWISISGGVCYLQIRKDFEHIMEKK